MPNILNIPLSGTIYFSTETAGASTIPSLTGQAVSLAHDGQAGLVVSSLNTATSATNRFRVNGANGALLAVTDEVTGTVFSVNDPAGLPIISADTGLNDVITIGTFGSNALVVRNDRVGIGTSNPNTSSALEIASTTRGFLPPRMTSTQRNAISGATIPSGLTVFNSTDNALSVYTTVLSSWDNIFTARAASFTADTLRNACSNDTGTGNLVFSEFPSLSSPTLISPVISSFYASSLPDTLSMCVRDGPIPKFRLFEDFGSASVNAAGLVGNNGFNFTSTGARGSNVVYTQASSNRGIDVLAHGINSITTGNQLADAAYYFLPIGGGGMVGCSGQYSFALSGSPVAVPNTIVDMRIGLNTNVVIFEISTATGQLNVVQGGTVGSSTTTLLSGITLSGGNFSYGTRYRFYYKIISATQVDVYFASAPFNSATWTAIYNGVATIPAMTLNGTENLVYPYFGLRTNETATKTMYVDWIAVEKDVTR